MLFLSMRFGLHSSLYKCRKAKIKADGEIKSKSDGTMQSWRWQRAVTTQDDAKAGGKKDAKEDAKEDAKRGEGETRQCSGR